MPDETPETPTDETATELAAIRAKLDEAEQELHNYKLRLADFENARRRLLRDTEIERKFAIEPLASDLLPGLDNLDRALEAAKRAGDTGPLAAGVSATVTQLLDALKRHGVSRMECGPGTTFDTKLHEAVMQQPGTAFEPGQVVQVLQHGYTIHDRVLRPASVIVASGD
jgi:molecular chaperone GrpE